MTDLLLASLCINHQDQMPAALRKAIIENLRDDDYGKKCIPPDLLPATAENIARILKEVCEKHAVSLAELKCEARPNKFANARFEACYRLRHELRDFSYPRIGRILGGRDHTTCFHAVKRHRQRLAEESSA